jgi:hypothetical protein
MTELREKQAKTRPDTVKTCRKCGIPQPLERFPFRKAEQTYRGTCKDCRAAESHALRHHPDHAERIREAERVRSLRRRPSILKWQREHPDRMRPGRQRRWARRKDKLAAERLAAQYATSPALDDQPPKSIRRSCH